jgi:hypothetical protein
MKRILTILLFATLAFTEAFAASRITLTVTLTNNPTGHNTFVFNGNTRTWTNAVTGSPSTLVSLGANIGASATNLFRHMATYPYSGPVNLNFSSSNVITVQGAIDQAVAASIAGTWASLSYSTQTITAMYGVRVPATGEPTQSTATNIMSLLSTNMGQFSTNPFAPATTLVQNLVQTTGAQDVDGVKNLLAPLFISAGIVLTNDGAGDERAIIWHQPSAGTDAKNFKIYSEEAGLVLAFLDDSLSSVGNVMVATRSGAAVDLITFGGPINASELRDCVATNSSLINSALGMTNTVTGNWRWSRANHTALANGNNAGVDFGTNIFVKIKAGPSAAFAICGIVGGADGRELKIYNSVAQNMTIANDSGVEPTAANRIYTLTGSDIATTGVGYVHLIYDSEDSRWIVQNYQP